MPRRSSAALSVTRIAGRPVRISPPKGLHPEAAAIFLEIVGAVAPAHFAPSDARLLAQYCDALALGERAARALRRTGLVAKGKASAWILIAEKAWRATVALAPKLRLCPSSRMDARAAGRRANGPRPSVYDLMEDGDE